MQYKCLYVVLTVQIAVLQMTTFSPDEVQLHSPNG